MLWYLKKYSVFFYTPTEALHMINKEIRLSGMLLENNIHKEPDGNVSFQVHDGITTINVLYNGKVPPMLQDGVVLRGTLSPEGIFIAYSMINKHDERYMPKNRT
ncbi:MAG: hypothetical protein P857_848 [Candidatus Xenolissoclinum pacificiensis L6]|uniref:Cytochrome c-type biogenesis protein CcmE n=1 Tax=Candidatus Xenolissoclinum pacificiensis L6 TaxID=1401685 RepID=W2V2L3_9RICK|nr:MAG: hypothetical protein P857_848 [Candidatus Xenolissoclinum pacificiensis L6]